MADDRDLTVGELKALLAKVPDHARVYMVPDDRSPYMTPTLNYFEQLSEDEPPPSLCLEDWSDTDEHLKHDVPA
jgi:hypothetical protein